VVVESVRVLDLRNLAACEVELGPGLNLLWGANGAGKTNLLEATYMALAGRSCRTRDDRETIAFGKGLARSEAVVTDPRQRHRFLCSISRSDGRRHLVDGSPAGPQSATLRPALAVFMPDRLALVKGPPAGRRSHLDGFCAAPPPARSGCPRRRRFATGRAARPPAPRNWRRSWSSAGPPTSLAGTPAGARITTSSCLSPRAGRCGDTGRRASSAPPCWPCCSPSAAPCSTTVARRR